MLDRFERFTLAIFEISYHWHKIAGEEMGKIGLKGTYAIYLIALHRAENGITAAKLGEICYRDKADVSRAVSLMEKNGIVEKSKPGSQNYRRVLMLTEKGKEAAYGISQRARLAVELAGSGVSESEREIFYQSLDKIALNLRGLSQDGLPLEKNREDD